MPQTLKAMREEKSYGSVMVYAVGPLIRPVGPPASRSQLLDWPDKQSVESVLYIAFGSLGVLSAQKGDDALAYLPDGFLERTHGLGLVVTQWAPQLDILRHPSTGGFLSHCGWNSSLESMLSGVPMIAWPMYAEQKMNATMLAEEVGVAVRPKVVPTKGVVGREEIEMMVRKVMEGQEGKAMRGKAKELKISGEKALNEGGSSFTAVSQLASQCVMNLQMHGK
jgi:coniferyl-alcohol glucosyltransferase